MENKEQLLNQELLQREFLSKIGVMPTIDRIVKNKTVDNIALVGLQSQDDKVDYFCQGEFTLIKLLTENLYNIIKNYPITAAVIANNQEYFASQKQSADDISIKLNEFSVRPDPTHVTDDSLNKEMDEMLQKINVNTLYDSYVVVNKLLAKFSEQLNADKEIKKDAYAQGYYAMLENTSDIFKSALSTTKLIVQNTSDGAEIDYKKILKQNDKMKAKLTLLTNTINRLELNLPYLMYDSILAMYDFNSKSVEKFIKESGLILEDTKKDTIFKATASDVDDISDTEKARLAAIKRANNLYLRLSQEYLPDLVAEAYRYSTTPCGNVIYDSFIKNQKTINNLVDNIRAKGEFMPLASTATKAQADDAIKQLNNTLNRIYKVSGAAAEPDFAVFE